MHEADPAWLSHPQEKAVAGLEVVDIYLWEGNHFYVCDYRLKRQIPREHACSHHRHAFGPWSSSSQQHFFRLVLLNKLDNYNNYKTKNKKKKQKPSLFVTTAVTHQEKRVALVPP
jgi:hypothetical protein